MFELFLIACIGYTCNYSTPPETYDSEVACSHQAALIAGMMSGDYAAQADMRLEFSCHPQGTAASDWETTKLVLAYEN